MEIEGENTNEILDSQNIKPPTSIFLKIKDYFKNQSAVKLLMIGIVVFGLLAGTGTYVLHSQKKQITTDSTALPTQVSISPAIPTTSPTISPSPTNAVITSVPTPTPTAAPTVIPLAIQIHLLDSGTGNPISNNGLRATINGQGLNTTIENQAEPYFTLSSPGTYQVSSNDPSSGYSADEISCSDNSKCRANLDAFCGSTVEISQGKIDVYCKYKSNGSSNNNSSNSSQSVNLSSIDPSSGPKGTSITLRGSGFGSSKSYVIFYNSSSGQASGGAPIDSWSETEIKARVPYVAGDTTYQVEVESSSGSKSNRASFTVTAG